MVDVTVAGATVFVVVKTAVASVVTVLMEIGDFVVV